eukprot:CAMPEP_0197400178 /NCGR_PEP_ID=MMETSP1165-20131217/16462_1 /TAXON_ID=284809 /ORGANISM="Chrysocystis fragilis, Strain CCMP3189" /LENGTH=76 /DNA_ID=CAMNT_0042926227 /DNA_START=620 /DNA_END=849 /DNA_ORIENTATION=+
MASATDKKNATDAFEHGENPAPRLVLLIQKLKGSKLMVFIALVDLDELCHCDSMASLFSLERVDFHGIGDGGHEAH